MPVESPPKNATEAIGRRLVTGEDLTALVDERITPNTPTQESEKPYVVFYLAGGGGGSNLSETRRLQQYLYLVESYGETDEQADAVHAAVMSRLCGDPVKGVAPWRDLAAGVQCCRPADDADSQVLDDGSVVRGQAVSIWFCPQV
jgi:hypothetical protein